LVAGVKKVLILMEHTTKDGHPKLLKECTLPLTGKAVVNKIITELGVFEISTDGIKISQIAPDVTLDEIKSKTSGRIKD